MSARAGNRSVSSPGASDIAERIATGPKRRVARLERVTRAAVLKHFSAVNNARIEIVERDSAIGFGAPSAEFRDPIVVAVSDPRAWPEIALNGAVGSGEAYMRGWWSCSDLTALVRALLVDRAVLYGLEGGLARFGKPLLRFWHWLERNSRAGARRNIVAHYDLGDDLFSLFLDETMCYSSGIFEQADSSLRDASIAKMDRLCRKLMLAPGDELLEIGSGWGGLAVHAASNYGCNVTTITLSENQYEATMARAREAGVADRVEVRLQDYRDVDGRFDKIVSVEMIEAVGHRYLDTYVGRFESLLADDGILALQAITIADQNYEAAVRSVDFIKKYIFPGGFLPSVTAIVKSATERTSLRLFHLEDIGFDYAKTLSIWRERFFDRLSDVKALGYSEEFIRMWEFYLCYCEGAFRERVISNVQMVFAKPDNRTPVRFG